jgi:hypothetical protein
MVDNADSRLTFEESPSENESGVALNMAMINGSPSKRSGKAVGITGTSVDG